MSATLTYVRYLWNVANYRLAIYFSMLGCRFKLIASFCLLNDGIYSLSFNYNMLL